MRKILFALNIMIHFLDHKNGKKNRFQLVQ